MAHLIDRDALVAEIERRIEEVSQIEKASYEIGLCDAYKTIISFIDTLEVKDIEDSQSLEREVAKGKNILILKKILSGFFESANTNDEEFSKAIEDIENGLI